MFHAYCQSHHNVRKKILIMYPLAKCVPLFTPQNLVETRADRSRASEQIWIRIFISSLVGPRMSRASDTSPSLLVSVIHTTRVHAHPYISRNTTDNITVRNMFWPRSRTPATRCRPSSIREPAKRVRSPHMLTIDWRNAAPLDRAVTKMSQEELKKRL